MSCSASPIIKVDLLAGAAYLERMRTLIAEYSAGRALEFQVVGQDLFYRYAGETEWVFATELPCCETVDPDPDPDPDPGIDLGPIYFGALFIGATLPPTPTYADAVADGDILLTTASISTVTWLSRATPQGFTVTVPALSLAAGIVVAVPEAATFSSPKYFDALSNAYITAYVVDEDAITIDGNNYVLRQIALTSDGQSSLLGAVTVNFRFTVS